MSNLNNAYQSSVSGLITNAGQIAAADNDSIADLINGAQLGYGPNLPQMDGATPLVFSPIIPIVTHIPTMFANVTNAPGLLKALFERHAKEINGIDFGLTLEGSPMPVGNDGQEAHMPTITRRTAVTPTFTWPELTGNLVWNLNRNWIEMIKHPDTQASSLSAINLGQNMNPMLWSMFTMSMLFIQFDPTMRPENIVDAFFIVNMWPQETGLGGFKRIINRSEMQDRQIAFHGVLQHNRNTKVAGQIIADVLGLHKTNYDFATPIATAIDSNILNMGLQEAATDSQAAFTDLDASYQPVDGTAGTSSGSPSTIA